MDKQKQNGSAAKEKRANILLTLCIVLIGIMLFLMTDKGAAMLASLGISNTNADYYEELDTNDYNIDTAIIAFPDKIVFG